MIYSNNFDKFQKIMVVQNFISVPFLFEKQFTILQNNFISYPYIARELLFVKFFFQLMFKCCPLKDNILKFLPKFVNRNINNFVLIIEIHVYIIDS
jgi:hypothetical protein